MGCRAMMIVMVKVTVAVVLMGEHTHNNRAHTRIHTCSVDILAQA